MKYKKIKFLFLFVILIIMVVFLLKVRKNEHRDIIYGEIHPFYGDIHVLVSTTGVVEPQNRVEIKPPIAGRIEEILVKEGDEVKKGDVLCLMSSTERAALLDSAHLKGEKELKYWKEVYKPTPLIAPVDGQVIVRAVEPGQTVTVNDTILVLSDRLIVKAQVDETDIGKVKLGQRAVITLDAYPDIKVEARVNHISYESRIINNVTIYEVDILPDRIPEVFRSGMTANVDIVIQKKENVLLIPQQAVIEENGQNFVLVKLLGKEAVKKRVTLGVYDDENIEVLEGLSENDIVLVKTQEYKFPSKKEISSPFMPKFKRKDDKAK